MIIYDQEDLVAIYTIFREKEWMTETKSSFATYHGISYISALSIRQVTQLATCIRTLFIFVNYETSATRK